MDYKIFITEDALADLKILLDYIGADNMNAANRFGSSLLNHVGLLGSFPRLGAPIPHRPDLRELLHAPIRVFYRIREDSSSVDILHFWHSARKPPEF